MAPVFVQSAYVLQNSALLCHVSVIFLQAGAMRIHKTLLLAVLYIKLNSPWHGSGVYELHLKYKHSTIRKSDKCMGKSVNVVPIAASTFLSLEAVFTLGH